MNRTALAAIIACSSFGLGLSARAQEPTATKRKPVLSSDEIAASKEIIAPPGAITEFAYETEIGGPNGRGEKRLFADGQFTINYWRNTPDKPGHVSNLSFTVFLGEGGFFRFEFSTDKMNLDLEPGFYDNAARVGSNARGQPGMSVDTGSYCSSAHGSFKILQADFTYKRDNFSRSELVPIGFAVEFEEHCYGRSAALRGHLYYNYVPPNRSR